MNNDVVKQLREIADTLEGRETNRKKIGKEIEIAEDEICDLRWCIDTIKSVLQFEGNELTEAAQNRLVEANKYLSGIYIRNLHLN